MMNIYESINAVMADVKAVGKNDKNPDQKYMYRGIDAVMNALNPALVKNKVFVVPEVLEHSREERKSSKGGNLIYSIIKVKYTFFAEDGTSVSAVVIGEALDSSDKSSNKAMSAAFKYACFQTFCLPTEEMIDTESETLEVAPKLIGAEQKAHLLAEMNRTGISRESICKTYDVESLDELTIANYIDAVEKFKKYKSVAKDGN